jgi:hypothetical protein
MKVVLIVNSGKRRLAGERSKARANEILADDRDFAVASEALSQTGE